MDENTQDTSAEAVDAEAVPAQDAATDAGQKSAAPMEAEAEEVAAVASYFSEAEARAAGYGVEEAVQEGAQAGAKVPDEVRHYVMAMLRIFHDELVKNGQIPPPPPVAG